MRLTIVQYAGDYREAWERFERGGKATYQAQRYSVAFVSDLAKRMEQLSVVCGVTGEPYDVVLPNGVRAIGGGLRNGFDPNDLLPLVAGTTPDRLVLVTPLAPLLRWASGRKLRTLATLADSFETRGVRNRIRNRLLAYRLNRQNVEWVGNHGISACLSLVRIGVRAGKIIPWDWPASHEPSAHAPRRLEPSKQLALAYVGSVTEEKGVGDLLRALGRLRNEGVTPSLTIIGRDDGSRFKALAASLGLENQVHFAGLIANEDVPAAMRAADVVVIPSRHEYPEGLPLTIYEALASRTPILASDHPMFRGALRHEESALVFAAGDDRALAAAIRRISADPALYEALSERSEAAWEALQLPVKWGTLIEKWLSDDLSDHQWIVDHSLEAGLYDRQIAARSG